LAAQPERASTIALYLRRPLFMLALYGGFVSLMTAGRLVPGHLLNTVLFWSFLPLYQIVALRLTTLAVGARSGFSRSVDLFFVGQAPWLMTFAVLAAICLFAPHVYGTFVGLANAGVFPGLLLASTLWSSFLTLAFLRAGLGLGWRRSLLGFVLHYTLYPAAIIGWFFATNQIQSMLWGSSW